MNIKYLVDEDIANYKKTSMFIGFPHCSFKCDKECGSPVCQNSHLATDPEFSIEVKDLVNRYINNPLSHAIVIGGLEPFDDYDDLRQLVTTFRSYTNDEIIIYTGYYVEEIKEQVDYLKTCQNIIIKYGRFIPNNSPHYDALLGVDLASDNQYSIYYLGAIEKDSRNENNRKL